MTHEEIEARRQELQDILERHETKKYEAETRRVLRELAQKVGASTKSVFFHSTAGGTRAVSDDADIPEMAHNIHLALQTAAMIDACRTAAQNVQLTAEALDRTRWAQRWTIIAVVAAIATAAAAIVMAIRA